MSVKHKLEAYWFLLRHYRKIFRQSWEKRRQLGGNLFKQQEAEFLPAALALQEKPVSPASRLTAKVLMALVAALFIWSVIGRMDIIVNAIGEIIPSERTKNIASVEVASVKAIHVKEGQVVKKGDVLVELDASAPLAEHDKAISSATEAIVQIARSRAMIAAIDSLKPPKLSAGDGIPAEKFYEAQEHLDGQFQDFMTKLKRLDGDINRYEQALPLATQVASDYKELAKNRDVAMHAYMEKEQARIELEGQLTAAKNQRAALIAEVKRAAYDDWTEGDRIAGASQPDARRAAFHSRLLKLVSPVDGTVQQLTVHTIGGVVPAAQTLMLIVPQEHQLEVEAMVENKDIGFVKEGQSAEVKVDAFEYTKYGTVPAHVVHISRDAVKDEKRGLIYSVRVALDKSSIMVNDRAINLSAGMSVRAEIKTGTRRVIEYVLSPLIQHARESLNER
ncbi:MAG TPA: HlyD family type I secretion periplasmic adaptor subunit [Syntrophales bacterium]|nr:HlyD family type I secretion periplasmic adaptor subunit [Syntrophales bacterium]